MKKHQEDSLLLNSRFMAYWEDLIVGLKIKGSEMSSSYALRCIPAVHVHQLCLTQNQWVTKWFSSLVSFLSGVVPQHVTPHTVGFGDVNRLVILPRDWYSIKWLCFHRLIGVFRLNNNTGVISTAKPLDYETNGSYSLRVEADSMGLAESNLRAPSKSTPAYHSNCHLQNGTLFSYIGHCFWPGLKAFCSFWVNGLRKT